MIRCAMMSRSSASAVPRAQPRAGRECSKTLTNCAPCSRSRGVGKVATEKLKKKSALKVIDHRKAWTTGSSPSMPKKAWGRSQPMPKGPSAISSGLNRAGPKEGRNSV